MMSSKIINYLSNAALVSGFCLAIIGNYNSLDSLSKTELLNSVQDSLPEDKRFYMPLYSNDFSGGGNANSLNHVYFSSGYSFPDSSNLETVDSAKPSAHNSGSTASLAGLSLLLAGGAGKIYSIDDN